MSSTQLVNRNRFGGLVDSDSDYSDDDSGDRVLGNGAMAAAKETTKAKTLLAPARFQLQANLKRLRDVIGVESNTVVNGLISEMERLSKEEKEHIGAEALDFVVGRDDGTALNGGARELGTRATREPGSGSLALKSAVLAPSTFGFGGGGSAAAAAAVTTLAEGGGDWGSVGESPKREAQAGLAVAEAAPEFPTGTLGTDSLPKPARAFPNLASLVDSLSAAVASHPSSSSSSLSKQPAVVFGSSAGLTTNPLLAAVLRDLKASAARYEELDRAVGRCGWQGVRVGVGRAREGGGGEGERG